MEGSANQSMAGNFGILPEFHLEFLTLTTYRPLTAISHVGFRAFPLLTQPNNEKNSELAASRRVFLATLVEAGDMMRKSVVRSSVCIV